MTKTYLYVIGAFRPKQGRPEAVKVGVARDVAKRLEGLQCGNHLRLEVLKTYTFKSRKAAYNAEWQSHIYLRRHRLCGEGFSAEDMDHVYSATQNATALARGSVAKEKVDAYEQEDHDTACILEFERRGL